MYLVTLIQSYEMDQTIDFDLQPSPRFGGK